MAILLEEDLQTRLRITAEKMRQSHFSQNLPLVYVSNEVSLSEEEFILEFKDGSRYVAVNHPQHPGYQLIRQL